MTRDQIANRVRTNLNDAGITFWSSQDLVDSIQDVYDEIAVDTQCIEKSTTFNSSANLLFYNLYQTITDFYAVRAIFNGNINLWLGSTSLMKLRRVQIDWSTVKGQPRTFCPISFEYTLLWPVWNGAVQSYTLLYTAQADTLTATSVPQIPTEFQQIVEEGSTADLLEQAQEIQKATRYRSAYVNHKKKLRQFMNTRMASDRYSLYGGG